MYGGDCSKGAFNRRVGPSNTKCRDGALSLIEEKPGDLTLIDTCFTCSIPKFETYVAEAGFDIKDIKRIVLTHLHPDHVEAANEIKRKTGAKIYSHWIDAAYLSHGLEYNGPPDKDAFEHILKIMGTDILKYQKSLEAYTSSQLSKSKKIMNKNLKSKYPS